MSDLDVMRWRRRRTARWMALSLAARGAVEGIVAACDERGELVLPPSGLRGLEGVLGRPWAEIGPALEEVFASGKLRYDEDRNVIVDPTNERKPATDLEEVTELRSQVATARAELAAAHGRVLSQSPDAVRARLRRAAARAAREAAQLELYAGGRSTTVATTVATAVATGVQRDVSPDSHVRLSASSPILDPVARPVATVVDSRSSSKSVVSLDSSQAIVDPVARPVASTAPSLSDLSSSSRKKREVAPRLELDPDVMPNGWLDHSLTFRHELGEAAVRHAWRKFALAKTRSFRSWSEVQGRWEGWLARERVDAPAPSTSPSPMRPSNARDPVDPVVVAPYFREARLPRPDEERPAPRQRLRRCDPPPFTEADRPFAARLFAAVGGCP